MTDLHTCPTHVGGGAIVPPAAGNVQAEKQNAARATDPAGCAGPTDYLVTGSGTVLMGNRPAARQNDFTMHGGVVVGPCRSSVLIGGPRVGATLGAPGFGNRLCRKAAQGRAGGSAQQTVLNCGVEASRQILLQEGHDIDEYALLHHAASEGWANREHDPDESGGTNSEGRKELLSAYGIESTLEGGTLETAEQAVADGKAVISSHDAGALWGSGGGGRHAVLVTGMQYDSTGKLIGVITNDSGRARNNCSRAYSPSRFGDSLRGELNVTSKPVMRHKPKAT